MLVAVVILFVVILLAILYSACKISGDISREEEYYELFREKDNKRN